MSTHDGARPAEDGMAYNGQGRPVGHRQPAQQMRQYDGSALLANPAKYFDELMKTEVDDHTVALLKNMFGREMMLGNLDEADYHEMRWLARNIIEFVYAEHPSTKSTFTGKRRAVLSGDYSNQLKPLNGMQKAWVEMAVFNFISILSRSKDGFQQEMNAKSINVHEAHRANESSGLRGLIPWGKG